MLKLVNEYLDNPSKARLEKIKRKVDRHPKSAMFLPSAVFIEIEAAKYQLDALLVQTVPITFYAIGPSASWIAWCYPVTKGKVMFDFDKYPRISVDGEGETKLNKLCSAIVKHYNASIGREELHVALLGLVDFCNLHNDGGRLTNFLNALPMNAPKRAIVLWLSAMTSWKLAENKNKQVIFKSLDDEGKTCTPYVMLEAAATPFYSYEPAKADATPKPFDFSGKVTDLIATGMKRLKAGKIDDPVEALLISALHDEMPSIILAMKAKAAAPAAPAANNVVALDAPAQAAA